VSWLQRNRWGLIVLGPALAAVVALSAQSVQAAIAAQPRVAVPADADGWYHLAESKMRLSTLEHATGLLTSSGRPFTTPPHVVLWRAQVDFEVGNDALIGDCRVSLEDDLGRTYDTDPDLELAGSIGGTSQGCLQLDDADPHYTNAEFFALPESAHPVAVRVVVEGYQPLYVRMPVPSE
jgi:hypothetical protein